MSNLIEHAKREFKLSGYTPLDQEQEDGPNKWIQENILELLEVFSKQGHSGNSAPYCIRCFEKLASFEPLSPITCSDDEWEDVSISGVERSGEESYQNKRLSAVFKKGKGGKPYYLSAIVFRQPDGESVTGSAFLKNGTRIMSHQNIKLPFTPKTFYIDVTQKEIAKDDWEHYIKDESQLDKVFEYYERLN